MSKMQNGYVDPAPTDESTLPARALLAVAGAAGVPFEKLATLEVPFTSRDLYEAVLEYAAVLPLRAGEKRPLFQNADNQFLPHSDDSDEEVGEEEAKEEPDVEAEGCGLQKRRYNRPNLSLGLGEYEVVWPPPVGVPLGDRSTGKVVEEGAEGAGEYGADKGSLWVVHSMMGKPMYAHGSWAVYRTATVVSARGEEALREFAAGVLRWRTDRDRPAGRAGRFCLHRFKSEGERGWWENEGMKRARPTESVVLPKGMLEEIMADVRLFLQPETKRWYVKHGLSHRRCLLMEGPPGTGKTSSINAIASMFKLNCCFLSTTCKGFSNQMLGDALSDIPENALLVLEDVDSLFNEDRKNEDGGSLTFSGLLNCLDGFLSTDGVLTVMTTNHSEKLDAALTRGGRVDRRFKFAKPVPSQVAKLFGTFYPDADPALAEEFARVVFARPEGDIARSIATLQQLFIAQRSATPEGCVSAVPDFFEMHFPNGVGDQSTLYM